MTKQITKAGIILLFFLFGMSLAGCGNKEKHKLLIGAAASLQSVMEELKKTYEEQNKDVSLEFSYAGSGSLEQQIRQGAPIDIFLSAAAKQMDSLSADQLILEDTRVDFAKNQVVLITPKDSKLNITDFKDIGKAKTIAIGDPKSVPAGQYAVEVFTYYNVLKDIESNTSYAKDVTEVLTWVSSGNADAGVVYQTDAALSKDVNVIATAPPESHSEIVYPAAVVKGTKEEGAAKDFISYLTTDEAGETLEAYGFLPVR